MATSIVINQTIDIIARFYIWDTGASTTVLADPVNVTITIYDLSDNSVVSSETPTRQSSGVYLYSWTPNVLGSFEVRFVGVFEDASSDVISQEFDVLASESEAEIETLLADEEIHFAGVLTPLYVNPDELIQVFPDATEIEIAEALWLTSTEVKEILKLRDDEVPTYAALEYVKVAAACNLSRIHASTMGDESTFRLGDLSITSRAVSKGAITRANATTWCELAGVLRKEMLASGSRMRAVVRGSDYPNPIPTRKYGNYNAGTRFISTLENPPRQGELDTFGPA